VCNNSVEIQAIFIDHLNKTAEFFRLAITFPAYNILDLIKTSRIRQHSTVYLEQVIYSILNLGVKFFVIFLE